MKRATKKLNQGRSRIGLFAGLVLLFCCLICMTAMADSVLALPSSLTEIEDAAFKNDASLTGILELPQGVTAIGAEAFSGCVGLTGVPRIPAGVKEIGARAFYGCEGLSGVLTLPTSVKVAEDAFDGCADLVIRYADETPVDYFAYSFVTTGNKTSVEIQSYCGPENESNIVIPSYIDGYPVTRIANRAFYDRSDLYENIVLPIELEYIGDYSFAYCENLTGELILPNTLYEIGKGAFQLCSGFSGDLYIPDSVTSIGYDAFFYCTGFDGDLYISNNISTINRKTFEGCSGFTGNLYLGKAIKSLKGWAFSDCSGFQGELILPDNIEEFEGYVFEGCKGFTGKLTLPETVKYIGSSTFKECSGFSGDLIIPEGVTTIEDGAFFNCMGLNGKLTLPSTLTNICTIRGSAVFSGTNLNSVVLPEQLTLAQIDLLMLPDSCEIIYGWKNTAAQEYAETVGAMFIPLDPDILVTGITLNKTSAEIVRGSKDVSEILTATVVPENAANKAITWSSSNTSVATVNSSGVVIAKAPGTATITATAADGSGIKASCSVTVTQLVTGLTLNKTSTTIKRSSSDKTEAFTATIAPTNAGQKTVTWSSSNTSVATVNSSGVVTAKAPGTATITATAADGSGMKASCVVTVTQLATGMTLNKTSETLKIGGTRTLTATITPANVSNKTVVWSSSNTGVAAVSSAGVVTAKAAGTATITATASDGSGTKATYTLTVASKPSISFTSYPTSVNQSQTGIDIVASLKGGMRPYTCQWTMYKDGEIENSTNVYTVTGTSTNWPIYQFGSTGVFCAELTLTDALGQIVTAKTPNCTVKAANLIEIAPTITSITTKNDSVTIQWNAVANAVKYIIKATRIDAEWTGEYTTTSTTWTQDWFSSGTYSFTVTAVGDSSVANNQKTSAAKSITVKVGNITSGPTPTITVSGNNATLKWNAITNATWYEIEIYTSAGYAKLLNEGGSTPKYIDKIGSDELYHKTSYTFSSLGTGMYIVKVAACNPGHWAFGSWVSFVIGTATDYPVKSGPQVTATVSGSTINVTWNAVENADIYDVFLYNSNGTLVNSLHTFENNCIFSGMADGTYRINVSARNTLIIGDDDGSLGGWKISLATQVAVGATSETKWLHGVPYYLQNDPDWAGVTIGDSTMSAIGCTTTCLAMSESYRTGTEITPDIMASRINYSGNNVTLPSNYSYYGQDTYSVQDVMNYAYKAINNGKPLIIGGYKYENGKQKTHWVIIVGYVDLDPNNMNATCFQINDPNSTSRTNLQQFLDYRGTIFAVCTYGTPLK